MHQRPKPALGEGAEPATSSWTSTTKATTAAGSQWCDDANRALHEPEEQSRLGWGILADVGV